MESTQSNAFPPGSGGCVHCCHLTMSLLSSGGMSLGAAPNSRFVPWTTAEMTFWRCKWTRRPHSCTTSPRNGPESWCRAFIFHLLRRDNQLPVACAMWQARSSGKPSACPYAARSTHISHTHLTHTSRTHISIRTWQPEAFPRRLPPAARDRDRHRGATSSATRSSVRHPAPCLHVPRAARARSCIY